VKQFCNREIEPMGRESDQLIITALAQALNISLRVEYLDQSRLNAANSYDFAITAGKQPCVTLLYRPGHYDILYK